MWGYAGTGTSSCPKKIAPKFPNSSWTGLRRTCPELWEARSRNREKEIFPGRLEVRHVKTSVAALHNSYLRLSKRVGADLRCHHSRRACHRRDRKSVDQSRCG